ncbi:MAG: GNAT family N-acetyltransferase [Deltaproteobacteria bacterium]|nr:MAG: GNAT family N-acetyltransferase [Deltaproteobacteria bacterium]
MLVFAREVYVCLCPTDVAPRSPAELELDAPVRFRRGAADDLARLDRDHHDDAHLSELAERLDRGEYWLLAEVDGEVVGYTWLHARPTASYPSLPGCTIALGPDTGYGYDAWTAPSHRGRGVRRAGFVEELRVLAGWGKRWEASFFVKHQLDGATRSLAAAGIAVMPIWRIYLAEDRTLAAEQLAESDAVRPTFVTAA